MKKDKKTSRKWFVIADFFLIITFVIVGIVCQIATGNFHLDVNSLKSMALTISEKIPDKYVPVYFSNIK